MSADVQMGSPVAIGSTGEDLVLMGPAAGSGLPRWVKLDQLLTRGEGSRKTLQRFRLLVDVQALVAQWLEPTSVDRAPPLVRLQHSAEGIQLAGRLEMAEGPGWFVLPIALSAGLEVCTVHGGPLVNFGPQPVTLTRLLRALSGPLEMVLQARLNELHSQVRPVPLLLRALNAAEGGRLSRHATPLWIHPRLQREGLMLEGMPLEELGAQGAVLALSELDQPGAEILHQLEARILAAEWEAAHQLLGLLDPMVSTRKAAHLALVSACPTPDPQVLLRVRLDAQQGDVAARGAVVRHWLTRGDALRACSWLKGTAQSPDFSPLVRWAAEGALQDVERLVAPRSGSTLPRARAALQALRARRPDLKLPCPSRSGNAELDLEEWSAAAEGEAAQAFSSPGTSLEQASLARTGFGHDGAQTRGGQHGGARGGELVRESMVREPVQAGFDRHTAPLEPAADWDDARFAARRSSTLSPDAAPTISEEPSPTGVSPTHTVTFSLSFPLTRDKLNALHARYEAREDWRGLLAEVEAGLPRAQAASDRVLLREELSQLMIAMGVPSRAAPHYEAVLQDEPEHLSALSFLRGYYAREGLHAERLRLEARQARALPAREAVRTLDSLAEEASTLKLPELERELLSSACEVDPRERSRLLKLSARLEAIESWSELVGLWRRHLPLIMQVSERLEAGLRIARYLRRQGELRGAERLYRGILRSDAEQITAIEGLVELLSIREEWLEVVELLQRLSRLVTGEERVKIALRLADLYAVQLDEPESADAWSREARVEAASSSQGARVLLARLEAQQDWKQLAALLESLIPAEAAVARKHELLIYLGDVFLVRLHDQVRAQESFRQAESLARAHQLSA